MNVVLYTKDMEPITVIDLPMWALEHGERLGFVSVGVMDEPIPFDQTSPTDPIPPLRSYAVTLEFHRLRMLGGKSSWLVTVDNDELALKMRPSWLPGQRGQINDYESVTRSLCSMLRDVLARGVGGH